MKRLLVLLSVAAASAFAAGSAQAEEGGSPTAGHGSAGLLLGYGFKDGVGLGLGARGGYTLPMNLYLGGTFVYHLGKSQSTPVGDVSVNIFYLGVEAGYDIAAGPVVVRPYLGLGPAFAHVSIPGGGGTSDSKIGFWPGATLIYPIGNFFIGADMRVLIVSDFTAFSLFATGGMQF